MDFLDPAKKRAHTIRLFIGYGLMTVLIGLITVILLFYTYGYSFDPATGTINQSSLVFIDSRPKGADIIINGEKIKNRTDTRLSLLAGHYDVEVNLNNYRPWKRSLNLDGGVVERLQYPLLFPIEISSQEIETLDALPAFASQSPDKRWLVVGYPAQFSFLQRFDLSRSLVDVLPVNLPANLLTSLPGNRTLRIVQWADDNNHVLIEHKNETAREFVILNLNSPADSFNVNRVFNLNPSEVVFRDEALDRLYLLVGDDGRLFSANVRTRAVAHLASGVLAFKANGADMLVYAQKTENPATARLMIYEAPQSYLLREVTGSSMYLLALARFNNDWYFAGGSVSEGKVYVYKNPHTVLKRQTDARPAPSAVLKASAATNLSFSPNSRFVALQGGQKFSVYDSETGRLYRYEINEPFDAAMVAEWMDGHHLAAVSAGTAVVFDYDGINVQKLVPAVSGMGFFFDSDYQVLYNLRPSGLAPNHGAVFSSSLIAQ